MRGILDYAPIDFAQALTLRMHYLFCCIPLAEFVVDTGFSKAKPDHNTTESKTPYLDRFRYESERIQNLLISEILICGNSESCAEAIVHLIEVAEIMLEVRSFHCLMLVVFTLQSLAIYSIQSAWDKVNEKIPGRWGEIQDKIGSGGNKLAAALIKKYSNFGVVEDLAQKARATDLYSSRFNLYAAAATTIISNNEADDRVDEKGRSNSVNSTDDLGVIIREFVPRDGDCFRWQLYITQLLRRTHLSGVVRSDSSALQSPMKKNPVTDIDVSELVGGNDEHQPCFPFLNGLVRGLVRSNELPDFIRRMDQATSTTNQLRLASPGYSSSDPQLPVLNTGKLRAIAALVAILRFCQSKPYSYATNTDNQTYFQKRAIYATEDAQWARAEEIEEKYKTKMAKLAAKLEKQERQKLVLERNSSTGSADEARLEANSYK